MYQKLRRVLPLVLAVLLLAALLPGGGEASGSGVYFTAANDQLMDLTSETMPFYSNGVLYVSSKLFEGGEVGLSYGRNTSLGLATLYMQGSNLDLRFDLAGQVAYDKQGDFYDGYAVEKGGVVFFPLKLVCRYFGLTWTSNETDIAPLIRVKSDSVILSDGEFISAATNLMTFRYDEYEKSLSQRPSGQHPSTPPVSPEPSAPDDPPVQAAEGQKVYLVFDGQDARDILPALGEAQATFLLTAGQMADGDLLRALVAGGHGIALRIEDVENAAEELRQGREALWRAACSWLELVWYDGEAAPGFLEGMGCVRVSAQVSLDGGASGLLREIGRRREDVAAFLGGAESLETLPDVLESLEAGRYRLSAWRLTA